MATFTMALKDVITATGGNYEVIDGVMTMTNVNIGLNYYPIFQEPYRAELNGKIIDRYLNREIGMESIPLFTHALRRKMNEIMPYFNKLYLSEQVAYDPLSTIDISTITNAISTQTGETTGTSDATTNATGASRSVNSETPQSVLNGSGDYATSMGDVNSNSNNISTGTQTANEIANAENDTTSRTSGYQGVASDLIMRYRESLLNIDLMVLSEIEELFMLVWDNDDSFTNKRGYFL